MKRVGVVGVGAVGRVYLDVLLQSTGVESVTGLVRSSSMARTPSSFRIHALHQTSADDGRLVDGYSVASIDDVRQPLDLVIVTTPSTALRDDGFIERIAKLPGEPVVLALQPGLDDRSRWLAHVPEHRLVIGTLALCAWTAPLDPSDSIREGNAYWVPPLSRFAMAGSQADVVADVLGAGGLPVKVTPGLERTIAIPSAAMVPIIAALEIAGWTFVGLRRSGRLTATARSVRQAIRIAAKELDGRVPLWTSLVSAPLLYLLTLVAGHVAPFDLERFLHVHFMKVSDQTTQQLGTWQRAGVRHGLSHDAIVTVANALAEARQQHPGSGSS